MIKAIYNTLEEIPEKYRDLYEEKDGKFHLSKIEGIKTEADVNRVQIALTAEKKAHKDLKTKHESLLAGKTEEEIQAIMDKFPELEELAASKGIDDEKINNLVEARIKTKLAPVQRELDQTKTKLSTTEEELNTFRGKDKQRTVHDAVRLVASKLKVLDTAQEDVLMLAERVFEINDDGSVTAKDGVGVTPGVSPEVWLQEMQGKRPHWWGSSAGGGAKGSGTGSGFGDNPWSAENWNLTKQGEIVRTMGAEKAGQMAKAAGSKLGAVRPTVKK